MSQYAALRPEKLVRDDALAGAFTFSETIALCQPWQKKEFLLRIFVFVSSEQGVVCSWNCDASYHIVGIFFVSLRYASASNSTKFSMKKLLKILNSPPSTILYHIIVKIHCRSLSSHKSIDLRSLSKMYRSVCKHGKIGIRAFLPSNGLREENLRRRAFLEQIFPEKKQKILESNFRAAQEKV